MPVFTCPGPAARSERHPRDVRSPERRHDAARHQRTCRDRGRRARSTRVSNRSSASNRSTRSSRTADPTAGPKTDSPRPRVPTTAASAAPKMPGRDIVEAHTLGVHPRRHRHRGHERRSDDGPVGVPGRRARTRSRSATNSGSRAGCSSASPRSSTSTSASTPSPSRVTGTARARTPTSRPSRCAPTAATTPSSRAARRSAPA